MRSIFSFSWFSRFELTEASYDLSLVSLVKNVSSLFLTLLSSREFWSVNYCLSSSNSAFLAFNYSQSLLFLVRTSWVFLNCTSNPDKSVSVSSCSVVTFSSSFLRLSPYFKAWDNYSPRSLDLYLSSSSCAW
jgi:hypothetical protein